MRVIKFLPIFIVAMMIAGCGAKINPAVDTAANKGITIGIIAPLSGPAAIYGTDAVNTYTLAVESFKKNNPTIEVEMIIEDGKCEGKDAVAAVNKLINLDKVDAIVGGICSSETIGAGKIAQQNGIVMISPVSSAPEISDMGNYIFRFYNDVDQTKVMSDYLEKVDAKKVVVIHENTDYSVALYNAFKNSYKGEILLTEKFNTNEKDLSIIIKKVVEVVDEVDMVIMIPQTGTTFEGLLLAIETEGVTEKFVNKTMGSETTYTEEMAKRIPNLIEGHIASGFPPFETFGEDAAEFLKEFKTKYTVESAESFVALEREAIELVLEMLRDGKSNQLEYLATINKDNPRTGYFGEYHFDEKGDAVGVDFVVNQVKNGKLVEVK